MVLKMEIPQEQFVESLEKAVDMLRGMHHQMPEDPKVLEITGVPPGATHRQGGRCLYVKRQVSTSVKLPS